ncbi:hypothetical protein SAMN04487895_103293 [Paenibacillus sophorae]|uniref:Uncharacterized protein n=1 Tax=Paenibacillus sophorae TaxID=1333845 RepID=A0A1H8K6T2_9BACL|nr:hypothetical protein [Paenibacillus sophorae]QWU13616.1 hypothetical protein KP014_16645 [Paenibacillus sophorae]SEN88108.1 hypothetical protein SAMN04487895_103293 [Paenibacillus sophorae]
MKKPIYTRWWFWVLLVIIALGIIQVVNTGKQTTQTALPSASPTSAGSQEPSPEASVTPSTTLVPGVSAENSAAPSESPSSALPATTTPAATVQPSAVPSQAVSADQVPLPKQEVLAYTRQLKSSPFIRDVGIGTDNIEIHFFNSFAEYKKANPSKKLTSSDYTDEFSSVDAVNGILMEESTRLFRQFPGTASIDITLPYKGKTYSVSLTKGSVEKFYNADLDSIKTDQQWRDQISGPFFTKDYRDQFAKRFVKVT